jgi:hypothetical protein
MRNRLLVLGRLVTFGRTGTIIGSDMSVVSGPETISACQCITNREAIGVKSFHRYAVALLTLIFADRRT